MGETVETPAEIIETLGETCGNTMGNSVKWLGNWVNMTEGITIIIMQKMKQAVLTISCVFNLYQNSKNLEMLYLNTFKVIN